MTLERLARSLAATASIAAILAATPFYLDLGSTHGVSLHVAKAWAGDSGSNSGKGSGSGSDDDEDDDSDDDYDDDNDDDDDDDDDDSDDDNDDSDDDDDDDDDDSSGRDKPRIPGGSGCDDPGDVAEHPECTPGGSGTGAGTGMGGDDDNYTEYLLKDGTKVELSADGKNVEVKYTDGSSEEIENGRYERKDTSRNTVEERPATAADFARLQAVIDA